MPVGGMQQVAGADLVRDVKINIVQRLDPTRRADRYALHACLLVSKEYFELAADRLWGSKTLQANAQGKKLKFLFEHVAAFEPAASDGVAAFSAGGGKEWRMATYLGAIRAITVSASNTFGDGCTIDPDRLLSCLPRLESVDAFRASEEWALALTKRFGPPHRPLQHLKFDSYANWRSFLALARPGLRSLSLSVTDRNSREAATEILGALMAGSGGGQLESLLIRQLRGQDVEAIPRYFVAYGSALRRLAIPREGLGSIPRATMNSVLQSLCHLVAVTITQTWPDEEEEPGEAENISALLTANKSTLVEFSIEAATINFINELPIAQIRGLRSLTFKMDDLPPKSYPPKWLASMTSLRQLEFTARSSPLSGLIEFMEVANGMAGLRELFVKFNEERSSDRDGRKEVRLRMKHLRKLHLDLAAHNEVPVRLIVVDAKDATEGFPLLEELNLYLYKFYASDRDGEGWEFPHFLYNAVLQSESTPALAYAHVDIIGASTRVDFYLAGGRSKFNADVLSYMTTEILEDM
ncbi:hypothetical protein HK101_008414 [Irineochytrium annulatum]|nr:hypothetical protein HK101_008414 [Irineochytrium annulatum]